MKNTILLFLFLLFSNVLIAQFSMGIGGGMNISTIPGAILPGTYDEAKSIVGYDYYISPAYKINSKFSFNSDFQFSQKGFKTEPVFYKYLFDYLIVNPKIEYRPIKNIGLSGGGYYGSLIRLTTIWEENQSSYNVRKLLPKDYGYTLGLQFYFSKLFIKGEFSKGLKDLAGCGLIDTDDFLCRAGLIEKNRSFHFGIGYIFGKI